MKLVLFDIDGTLITSRGAGRRAMRTAFERIFGTAGGIDHYDLRGRTDTRIVHEVMAAAGWEAARIKERYHATGDNRRARRAQRGGVLTSLRSQLAELLVVREAQASCTAL